MSAFDVGAFEFINSSSPGPSSAAGTMNVGVSLTAPTTEQSAGTLDVAVALSAISTPNAGQGALNVQVDMVGRGQAVVVELAENPKKYLLRVREARIGANGIVEFELSREDLSIYPNAQSPLLGSDVAGGGPPPPSDPNADDASDSSRPGSTRLVLLDLPQLLAEHTQPGFYAAASGLSAGWNGAQLYRKVGQEYVEIAQLGDRAVIGRAENKLNSGVVTLFNASGRTYQYDDVNTVDITLIESISTLTSVSNADLLAGANIAALGQHGRWEIIGFGTVTQLAARKYRLSHLLRGLKGTEHAVGNHKSGDQFVVLDSALRRITDEYSDLGVARKFRAVSIGNTFGSASDGSFTNTGVSLEPLSPVYIRGEEDSGQNRIIRWWGRSRYDGLAGRDGTAAPPPDEAVIRYEVDILNAADTTVLRTITALGEAAGYSAAQQTADHGSVPSSLKVNIYKISDNKTIGRGYVGSATISAFAAVDTTSPGSGTGIYDVYVSIPGLQRSRRITVTLVRPLLFRAGMGGSWGRTSATSPAARPVATAQSQYSLQKNGVQFGTATFALGANTAVVTSAADAVFVPGVDTFEVVEPVTADATLKDVGLGFAGERI